MNAEILIAVAAFLLGLMWGLVHTSLWIQLHTRILVGMSNLLKKIKNESPIDVNSVPEGSMYKFIGSIFGSGATGGIFALLENASLNVALYIIGIFLGFAPSLSATVWKLIIMFFAIAAALTTTTMLYISAPEWLKP